MSGEKLAFHHPAPGVWAFIAEFDFLSGECRWHTQANFSRLWSSSRHEIGLTTFLTCPSFSNICNTYFSVTLLTCFLLPLGVWVPNTVLSQDQADLPKLPNKKASNNKYKHDSVIFTPKTAHP